MWCTGVFTCICACWYMQECTSIHTYKEAGGRSQCLHLILSTSVLCLFHVYECFCFHVCLCTMCMPDAHRSQKRELDFWNWSPGWSWMVTLFWWNLGPLEEQVRLGICGWAWWSTFLIPAFGKQRQVNLWVRGLPGLQELVPGDNEGCYYLKKQTISMKGEKN